MYKRQPYKFAASVLTALGENPAGGFAALDELHARTGVPVPKNLAAIRDLPVLHTDAVETVSYTHLTGRRGFARGSVLSGAVDHGLDLTVLKKTGALRCATPRFLSIARSGTPFPPSPAGQCLSLIHI